MTKCSFCNTVGHTIRQCNSDNAKRIRTRFRRVASELDLDQMLAHYTSPMLSIVMLMYNANNISCVKSEKLAYIKEKWLSGEPLISREPEQARQQEQRLREGPNVNEAFLESYRFLQEDIATANSIYTNLCVNIYHIPVFVVPHPRTGRRLTESANSRVSELFILMIVDMVSNIIQSTQAVQMRALRIMRYILEKLKIPIKRGMRNEIQDTVLNYLIQQLEEKTSVFKEMKVKTVLVEQESPPPHAECAICYDVKEQVTLNCNHGFCVDCIDNMAKTRKKSFICCALCREEVTEFKVATEETKTRCETQINRNVVVVVA